MCNEESLAAVVFFDAPRKKETRCIPSTQLTDVDDSTNYVFTFGTEIFEDNNDTCFDSYKPLYMDYFKSLAEQK